MKKSKFHQIRHEDIGGLYDGSEEKTISPYVSSADIYKRYGKPGEKTRNSDDAATYYDAQGAPTPISGTRGRRISKNVAAPRAAKRGTSDGSKRDPKRRSRKGNALSAIRTSGASRELAGIPSACALSADVCAERSSNTAGIVAFAR